MGAIGQANEWTSGLLCGAITFVILSIVKDIELNPCSPVACTNEFSWYGDRSYSNHMAVYVMLFCMYGDAKALEVDGRVW